MFTLSGARQVPMKNDARATAGKSPIICFILAAKKLITLRAGVLLQREPSR